MWLKDPIIIGRYGPSEHRVGPKLQNSLLISLLAGNLGVETGSTTTACATNIFNSFLHLAALRLLFRQ